MSDAPVTADTHVHIDAYRNREAVLDAARDAGVLAVVVTGRASEYRNLAGLLGEREEGVRLGLGLHPEAAGSVYAEHELAILRDHFAGARWIAEIGLDGVIADSVGSFFGSQPSLDEQRRLLERILELGVADKVLSVHSRGAEPLLADMLVAAGARAASFHWFRGDRAAARRVADAGYYFSVNVEMLRGDDGRRFVEWLPEDRILFETDGPFTDVDGRPSEPRDVVALAGDVAQLRGVTPERILELSIGNFRHLESLAGS